MAKLVVALMLAALAVPAAAQGVADPLAFVQGRYAQYQSGDPPVLALDTYASARLRAKLYAHDEAAGGEEVGDLDFWVDGRAWPVADLSVTREPGGRAGQRTILARFTLASRRASVRFFFVREGEAWALDEAADAARGRWTLSCLLAQRPGGAAPCRGAAARLAAERVSRGVADPRDFVARTYAAYRNAADATPPEPFYAYSARLAALFAAYDRDLGGGDLVGALDFDWWVNAQEWALSDIRGTQTDPGPGRRIVVAGWKNGDRTDSSRFHFLRWRGRWYLDDVVNGTGGGDGGWTLSALLRERP